MEPERPTTTEPSRATCREWIALAVIALPCLLYSMDLTVLYLAVPSLTADLAPSSTELLWITDVYGFLLAGWLVTMGTLGDRVGRRRLLLVGAAAFGLASVLAAFSTSVEMLVASRAILGVAAATLAPSTLSLIRNMFLDPAQRSLAIGIWAMSFSVGAALGPLLGGVLLEFFWWGSVFLLAVPVMALLLVLGPRLLPEFRDPGAGRLDLASVALSVVGVLALVYGLKRIAEEGFGPAPAVALAVGLALGVVFVRRQRGLVDPLLDVRLFRIRAFGASLAANTLGIAIAFGIFLFVAQYLQLVEGLSPFEAGLWTLPSSGGFIVGSLLAPLVARRVRPASTVAGAFALAAAGFGLLTLVGGGSALEVVVAGTVLVALGIAPVVTLATDLVVGSVPPERAGTASGISETGAELGGAAGIAVLGSVGVSIYRRRVADGMPEGVPAGEAEAAEDTLAGALETIERLPADVAGALVDVAQEAFVQGFQVAAAAGGSVALAMAVATGILLRSAGPGAEPAGSSPEARGTAGAAGP